MVAVGSWRETSIVDRSRLRGGSWPLTPLGPGRSDRARRSWRTRRSRRSGEATILYHNIPRIRPGSDLHDAGGGKFRSNPPKSSSRSALDLHCFARADLDLHAGLAGPPYSSDDDQLALRYVGSRDEDFRMYASSARHRIGSHKSCDRADRLREHHDSPPLNAQVVDRLSESKQRRQVSSDSTERANTAYLALRLGHPQFLSS